ncbi:MAG TPA: glycosyltransferase [bacterium]|nr:glycosyltransferase [bacterium]
MTGRLVICIAPTEWDGAWQRYHEMMRRLAASGNTVLVVDSLYRIMPPLPRSRAGAVRLVRKAWEVIRRMRFTPRWVEPHLAVLTPPVLPGSLHAVTSPFLRAALRRFARTRGRPVLWCAFPAPGIDALARALAPVLTVYDCASAFGEDPAVPAAVVEAEARLLRLADLVFTDSRNLWEHHRAAHARCHWIPTGVDAGRFAAEDRRPPRGSQPVVGYVGTVHAWLDVDLIEAVARRRPLWRFVFAGPLRERAALSRLQSLPNVELIGAQPHDALPSLLAGFAVTWIPYRITPFTRYVFPTKMLEYLAAGTPVVSTDLAEVRAFAPPVRIAPDAAGMAAALEAAMQDPDPGAGRDLAMHYDWTAQMAAVHRHLDGALASAGR